MKITNLVLTKAILSKIAREGKGITSLVLTKARLSNRRWTVVNVG